MAPRRFLNQTQKAGWVIKTQSTSSIFSDIYLSKFGFCSAPQATSQQSSAQVSVSCLLDLFDTTTRWHCSQIKTFPHRLDLGINNGTLELITHFNRVSFQKPECQNQSRMTEIDFHRVIVMRDDVMRPCTCTYCLMSWMASSYFIPLSIRANATKTGALCALTNIHTHSCLDMPIKDNNLGCSECVCYLPSPATQWTATQHPGSSWNFFFSRLSQSSTNLLGGGAPSSNGQSWGRKTKSPAALLKET